jgi:hypothetical protein
MRKRIWITAIMLAGCAQVFAWNSAQGTGEVSIPSVPIVAGPPLQLPGQLVDLTRVANATREFASVTFSRPVRAMNVWLLGPYLIEHDTERMARGEQCTRIFRAGDRTTPVVAFHCEHLARTAAAQDTVVVVRTRVAPAEYELSEFQFAGSTLGHGLPRTR